MTSRAAHRLRLFADRDALHAGAVALAACLCSAGLVYVGYYLHVLRVARRASCVPERGDCVLLFGKHAPRGRIDADFEARLARAAALWRSRPRRRFVLLGGGAPGAPSEAELAHAALLARGVAADAPLLLEAQSRDTLQNLRNARRVLDSAGERGGADAVTGAGAGAFVTLLSSRYHLARCALFARHLGFDCELCAAEPAWRWRPGTLLRIAGEAGYVCWVDVGARWARLIGHRRMLTRLR